MCTNAVESKKNGGTYSKISLCNNAKNVRILLNDYFRHSFRNNPIKGGPKMEHKKPMTAPEIIKKKGKEKIVVITAYDFTIAQLVDQCVDMILVGDSLGCVVQGHNTTLSVTLDEMIYHSKMVSRGAKNSLVIGDLPFGSYQVGTEDAIRSSIRMVKEAGVGAVKLEGGVRVSDAIKKIVASGIPVVGHIGLTPQSYHTMGGNKIQGKTEEAVKQLKNDARSVQKSGAFAVVLEAIPAELAFEITSELKIPTIAIGAGPYCDGQVLVFNDMIGLNTQKAPMKFNKEYCALRDMITSGVKEYASEVRKGFFPSTPLLHKDVLE